MVSVIKEVEILTVKEIQDILKISRSKVYELINSKTFPIIKFGKNIRVDKKDFINWLESQKELSVKLEKDITINRSDFMNWLENQKEQYNFSHKTIREEKLII